MKKIILFLFWLVPFLANSQTDAALITSANTIKNETRPGANSAARIGQMYLDIISAKVSILAPQLTTSSTNGYVWTAVGTSGLGSWQPASGGGGGTWGSITGTLSNQTDLQSAIDAKQNTITFGTGVQTWLTTPSSTNLYSALTTKTGNSSNVVFSDTPTLTTPVINGLPTGTGVSSSATASTLVARDANANNTANNFLSGYTTTATASGTTTLTVSSTQLQYFTGSLPQTVVLPVTSTLSTNPQTSFTIVNNSSGSLIVNTSGSNLIQTMAPNSFLVVSCISTSGTGISSWNASYYPQNPMTSVGDLIVGSTVVNGVATPSRMAPGTERQMIAIVSGLPAYQTGIVGTTSNDDAAAGSVGEEKPGIQSTYTNYTTSATYQNITSIQLTAGDWDVSAVGTFSTNSATITSTANAIFVISTTTASASGSTEGRNIVYIPQSGLVGTATKETVDIPSYRVSIASTTTYYLNTQATFTVGNPQFVGSIRARRIR